MAGGPDWEQPAHRARRGSTVVLLVGVVVVVVAAAVASGGAPADELTVEEAVVPAAPTPVEDVRELTGAPIAGRGAPVHAWTGSELVVWGGFGVASDDNPPRTLQRTLHDDGAAYEAQSGRWRGLAPSPLAPRRHAVAAWTGERLLVWGGADAAFAPLDDGAAYLPAGDRWEPLADAPIAGRAGAAGVWTGAELLVLGGSRPVGHPERLDPTEPLADGAAYDPAADTWRLLAPPPDDVDPRALPGAVWAGDRLVVWQGLRGAAYHPDEDRWEPLALPFDGAAPRGLVAVAPLDAGRMAVFGLQPAGGPAAAGVVYDLDTGEAAAVPPAEPHEPVWPPRLVAADGRVLFLPDRVAAEGLPDRRALVWDARTGRWAVAPPVTEGRASYAAVWTGEELLVWGGFDGRRVRDDGLRWRPAGATAAPSVPARR